MYHLYVPFLRKNNFFQGFFCGFPKLLTLLWWPYYHIIYFYTNSLIFYLCTICPRSLDLIYIVPYYIKWAKTFGQTALVLKISSTWQFFISVFLWINITYPEASVKKICLQIDKTQNVRFFGQVVDPVSVYFGSVNL